MWKLSALALAGLAVGLAGCSKSGPSAKLTGKVTYQGQPLKCGVIYFKGDDGQYDARIREEDGSYAIGDLPTGTYTVLVDNETWNPDQNPQSYVKSKGGKKIAAGSTKGLSEYNQTSGGGEKVVEGGQKKEELARVYVKLPRKYADAKTSTLKYTVVDGAQTKDFDLTD